MSKQRRTPDERDLVLMREALRRARSGTGATYPNPCVGAVIVRGRKVVAVARTGPTGSAHAEVRALKKAGALARGATLYVTLEPCSHHGRTPPCTTAIIEAGIERVMIAVRDPNPKVAGRGVRKLRRAGIEVFEGVAADEGEAVHAHYLHHHRTGRPWVTLKVASSLDGRIATPTGDSRWITSEASRRDAHRMRAEHHAIAVGRATVQADDPALTVRLTRGVDPIPVIFDAGLRSVKEGPKVAREGSLWLHGPKASSRARRSVERSGGGSHRAAAGIEREAGHRVRAARVGEERASLLDGRRRRTTAGSLRRPGPVAADGGLSGPRLVGRGHTDVRRGSVADGRTGSKGHRVQSQAPGTGSSAHLEARPLSGMSAICDGIAPASEEGKCYTAPMFTGLVQTTGRVRELLPRVESRGLVVEAKLSEGDRGTGSERRGVGSLPHGDRR